MGSYGCFWNIKKIIQSRPCWWFSSGPKGHLKTNINRILRGCRHVSFFRGPFLNRYSRLFRIVVTTSFFGPLRQLAEETVRKGGQDGTLWCQTVHDESFGRFYPAVVGGLYEVESD